MTYVDLNKLRPIAHSATRGLLKAGVGPDDEAAISDYIDLHTDSRLSGTQISILVGMVSALMKRGQS